MSTDDCGSLKEAFPAMKFICCADSTVVCSGGRITELNLREVLKTASPPVVSIPDLSKLDALTVLDLSYNDLSGPVHPSVFKLTNLYRLSLNNNKLQGGDLAQLLNLRKLKILDLGFGSNNFLGQEIPSNIGALSSLELLRIGGIGLGGKIPESLAQLTSLTYLDISWNSLYGSIPGSLSNLVKLTHMYFGNNGFLSGTLPEEFSNLKNLQLLEVHSNSLRGNIPTSYGLLRNLKYFTCHQNYLQGTVPDFVYLAQIRTYGLNCFTTYRADGVRAYTEWINQFADQRTSQACQSFLDSAIPTSVPAIKQNPSESGDPPSNPTVAASITPGPTSVAVTESPANSVSISLVRQSDGVILTVPVTVLKTLESPATGSGVSTAKTAAASTSQVDDGGNGGLLVAVAGGMGAAFVLIVGIAILLIVLRRREAKRRKEAKAGKGKKKEDVIVESGEQDGGEGASYAYFLPIGDQGFGTDRDEREMGPSGKLFAEIGFGEGLEVDPRPKVDALENMFSGLVLGDIKIEMEEAETEAGTKTVKASEVDESKASHDEDSETTSVSPTTTTSATTSLPPVTRQPILNPSVPTISEVSAWNADQVSVWLESMDVSPRVAALLRQSDVTGYKLLLMTDQRLVELGLGGSGLGRENVLRVVERIRGVRGGNGGESVLQQPAPPEYFG
ncbi:hypothetical protein HDU97_002149 [Phlyctochytrium planicorne]|nr:hypothetical protein HDU97_002149 [Phlyctochytrium planicorne]